MVRSLLSAALALLLAACTTYKLWEVVDSDRDTGIVSLSYEYGRFESPQVDERAGVGLARERCQDWGYPQAQRKSEDRQCLDGEESRCNRWRVVREYRCVKKAQ